MGEETAASAVAPATSTTTSSAAGDTKQAQVSPSSGGNGAAPGPKAAAATAPAAPVPLTVARSHSRTGSSGNLLALSNQNTVKRVNWQTVRGALAPLGPETFVHPEQAFYIQPADEKKKKKGCKHHHHHHAEGEEEDATGNGGKRALPPREDSFSRLKRTVSQQSEKLFAGESRPFAVMMLLTTVYMLTELAMSLITGSIALEADSFHMLSDVLALGTAWWAQILAKREANDKATFGWGRAEVICALGNCAFLLGITVEIILSAVDRLLEFGKKHSTATDDVAGSSMLMLSMGIAGLILNVGGMVIFGGHHHHLGGECSHGHGHSHKGHSHGHSHGHHHHHHHGHSHSHSHSHSHGSSCSHGHGHSHTSKATSSSTSSGSGAGAAGVVDVTKPQTSPRLTTSLLSPAEKAEAAAATGAAMALAADLEAGGGNAKRRGGEAKQEEDEAGIEVTSLDCSGHHHHHHGHGHRHGHDNQMSLCSSSMASMSSCDGSGSDSDSDSDSDDEGEGHDEETGHGAAGEGKTNGGGCSGHGHGHGHGHSHSHGSGGCSGHGHSHSHGHGHSHSHGHDHGHHHAHQKKKHVNLNMQATYLHMLGDALGSLGIILSALAIRYGEPLMGRYRLLADPLMSLAIVGIIISTTWPVVRQSSRILLNFTPKGLNLALLRQELLALPHVLDIHALHVWSPSNGPQLQASMHVVMSSKGDVTDTPKHAAYIRDASAAAGQDGFPTTRRIRQILRKWGITSMTVQTEIIPEAIASLPLPEGTTYRCLSAADADEAILEAGGYILSGDGQVSIGNVHNLPAEEQAKLGFLASGGAASHDNSTATAATTAATAAAVPSAAAAAAAAVPSAGGRKLAGVSEKEALALDAAAVGDEDDGALAYHMIRTTTNTISAETPCHRHHHHHHHHHHRKPRTFNEELSPSHAAEKR